MLLPSRHLLARLACTTLLCGTPAVAEMTPSLNISGTTGLIDMPSGEAQDSGTFSFSVGNVGPITRTTLSFQFSERISGSYRFQTWRNWDTLIPGDSKINDQSLDLRYLILKEGKVLPAVTIGINDFTGENAYSAEYIAATKSLGEKIKVTAGLGWGRFGSYESIGSPFGDRPEAGTVGRPNVDQWFKGDAAVFGGVEVKVTDTLTVKGEYSSDAYTLEDDERGIIDRASPFNFGLEYQKGPNARYGLYYVHGTEIGFALHLVLDPKTRVTGGVMGAAPMPVKLRPTRSADPEAYDGGWVTQPDAAPLLQNNLAKRLAVDGIVIDSLSYTATTVQIRIRNNRIDAGSQAIGRTARALTHVMPASVEVFEIVPVVNGIGASKVTIRRSDLEELEYVADNSTLLRERVTVTDAGKAPVSAITDSDPYPDFSWGLKPALRVPQPAQAEVGARLSANYILRPGLVLKGSIYGRLFGNVDYSGDASGSTLQPVRSDGARYAKFGNPALEELTLAWYARPAADVYSRFTVGYLERMHAGVSGEILWKRVDNPLALGVELNYTLQRDTDGFFGVDEYDYDVVTGYVSAYYDFGNGYLGQLDVGRYLAGDFGATVSIDRIFVNGWRIGAFATVTDASGTDFGEGTFDKGVRFSVPLNWAVGNQTKQTFGTTLRPNSGDGGARLNVDGRLYESVRDYHTEALDPEWGRVWR
ncbi:MAG: hypothetical protein B7Z10_06245 [Rhodobacterales bacterium 32-66-7]|nr:MAG: hypothetical protein B7Z31_09325 [Rhodobacterales bacterium 12-65-15]OYX25475.1 MAG: hypothetical protein B7Z10_06245 [Rhodobacterales bacterium 32-66-7]